MDKIQWDESYSIGIDLIDQQHKEFIGKLSDVYTAIEGFQGPTEISKTLAFLDEYTQYHFGTEAKNMKNSSYPRREDHLAKHNEFRATLKKIEQDFQEEGATKSLAEDVKVLLVYWFLNHILEVDKEFGAYLEENNIEVVE